MEWSRWALEDSRPTMYGVGAHTTSIRLGGRRGINVCCQLKG